MLDDNERFASVRSVFLWVDVFCVNQHDTNPLNKLPPGSPVANAFWMGAFRTALSSAGTTLVVLEPHDAPACLTRTWCAARAVCLEHPSEQPCSLPPVGPAALLRLRHMRFDPSISSASPLVWC